ncbi:hsp90-like protein [Phlyctema vagabunda]|uniref:histidine kinase n=1 Tax=Phlyctema vagabunda TaxID=108571 RepID=A0ABR4PLD2_9HELO
MAPITNTVALSHAEGVSDSARARELYKYYQPTTPLVPEITALASPLQTKDIPKFGRDNYDDRTEHPSKIVSPDTALTAFSQLVAWRTGAQRAMISVIDAETQYFVAESTRSLDLVDGTKHDPGDDLWMGCSSVEKAGRLCERTISVVPAERGVYPSFIINDLRTDERFNQLPFVTGPPFIKFYAGVPLITKRGIPIGSLFIIDDRVRNGLTVDEIHFMGTMAETIMKHLEMAREVEEHRRGMKMSRGLASFVEGRAELVEAELDTEEGEGTKIAGQFETDLGLRRTKSKSDSVHGSTKGSVGSIERKEREYSSAMMKTEEAIIAANNREDTESVRATAGTEVQPSLAGQSISSLRDDPEQFSSSPGEDDGEEPTMKILFSRAANLIREAFEVDGGAVFYDAQKGFRTDFQPNPRAQFGRQESAASSCDDLNANDDSDAGDLDARETPLSPTSKPSQPSTSPREGLYSRNAADNPAKEVEILGFSTAAASSIHGDEYPESHSFVPFDEKSMHTLLRRFPRGKLWTFDTDGAVSSSSEEEEYRPFRKQDHLQRNRDASRRQKGRLRNQMDAIFLLKHFPGVRQLLFVPLWDASRSRWLSGCFAWSTEPTRVLSKQSELAFLTAFGNSVMAECSRIDTEIADQKKGDFIGSISHELRSPLHGILASAEFLSDEVTEGFSKGLVETIDSCGRTLLDTINHILDFSKINHFEKNWRKNKRGNSRTTPPTNTSTQLRQADLPMINLFADVDVSVVCEEVVEGVFAGHVFQNVTAKSFDMVPDAHGKMSDPQKLSSQAPSEAGLDKVPPPEVAVILDVDIQNYHFITQPGAFRRVIMNLLGNALKYTSHGFVQIKLEAKEIEDLVTPSSDPVARSMVTLTIQDTGKGISAEFLRSKLFTPFAQENSLSSGTGLGLSIVRSIVALLEGEIEIDSEPGRGTQVRVSLPLLRDMPKTTDSIGSATSPKSNTAMPRDTDESVSILRSRVLGQRVSLYGFDLDSQDPILYRQGQLLKASVTNFLTNWYGLEVVPLGQRVNFIVANEANPTTVSRLSRPANLQGKPPSILVLCSHSSRFDRNLSQSNTKGNCGFVAKPVGPLKLARAILQVLQGAPVTPGLPGDPSGSLSPENNDLSNVFEELTITPEVLDNSRMAADSDNARKAIESPTPVAVEEKNQEFPFPSPVKPQLPKKKSMPGDAASVQTLSKSSSSKAASSVLTSMEMTAKGLPPDPSTPTKFKFSTPRLLLVDDNKINLSLLRTYMRKRKYNDVDEAENGLDAVNKARERDGRGDLGYDIIFMDISMPILDGFGATRQIRAIEESRKKKLVAAGKKVHTPALVIALTGLASSRDQSEAFSSGIDLFLTKPVSFKEVGKMLDNWEANRERESKGESSSS